MKSVRPFLLALAPLLVGIAVYWFYWRAEADGLAAAVEQATGERPEMSGFPYRLSASLGSVDIVRGGEALSVRLQGGRTQVGSNPFRSDLYVALIEEPRVAAGARGLDLSSLGIAADVMRGSLRVEDGRIARLSLRAESARIALPLFDSPVQAAPLEFHLRETPDTRAAAGPTPAGQAEARIAGTLAWPSGIVTRLSLPVTVTADAPLTSFGGWRSGGTLEVEGGTIAARGGDDLAGFDATLAALPDGALALSGTLSTECPGTVTALLEGRAPTQPEYRTRRPAKFALAGTLAQPALRRLPGPSGGNVRSREPPCPDLRR